MTITFGERLAAEFAAKRHLCAGIDPHAPLLTEWGYNDDAASAERMGREVVAAAAGVAACVKPQVAFFERFGSAGFIALERVLADAREAGLLVIADVKRGDIGSSFAAYADAWLQPGSPLESDAMTVAAYQGIGTLNGAMGHVRNHGKGLFVLAATSNPEAREVQQAVLPSGQTLAASMVEGAHQMNVAVDGSVQVGSVGVVLGATLKLSEFSIDTNTPIDGPLLPVLAPGFGFQGAAISEVTEIFGTLSGAVLANESRSILTGGAQNLSARICERAEIIADSLPTTHV